MSGLLKKACEISLLCGVEVAVSFTDLKGNLHSYKNSSNLSIKPKKRLIEMKDTLVIEYKTEDYPFERKFLTGKRRKIKIENNFKMLGKRNPNTRENYEEKLKEDMSKFDKILKKDSSTQNTESEEDSSTQGSPPRNNSRLTLRYRPKFKPEINLHASCISSIGKFCSRMLNIILTGNITKIIMFN